MGKIEQEKAEIRNQIVKLKQSLTRTELDIRSEEVLSVVEITGIFQEAKNILIYYSLSDEVSTSSFIQKWSAQKKFYLPIIENNSIQFRLYQQGVNFNRSELGIMEPEGDNIHNYSQIDLIIVPGMAFDRNKNRLGRGKGYYDQFLSEISKPKMGICFEFQLLDFIPTDTHDIKMDYVISENDFVW